MLSPRHPPRPARQAGFTLIEMMVAVVTGLLVVGAGIATLSYTFGSNSSALRITRMNQDLRGILNAISSDLTRAGSWALAVRVSEASSAADLEFSNTTGTITATALQKSSAIAYTGFTAPLDATALTGLTLVMLMPNAMNVTTRYNLTVAGVPSSSSLSLTIPSGVTLPATSVRAGSWTLASPFSAVTVFKADGTQAAIGEAGKCILFSYDLNSNGLRDANERFGYRYDATAQALEASTTATSCNAGSAWQNVTDEDVLSVVDVAGDASKPGFAVTQILTPATAVGLLSAQVREYSLALGGQLKSDTTSRRDLRGVAEVRNHLVQ